MVIKFKCHLGGKGGGGIACTHNKTFFMFTGGNAADVLKRLPLVLPPPSNSIITAEIAETGSEDVASEGVVTNRADNNAEVIPECVQVDDSQPQGTKRSLSDRSPKQGMSQDGELEASDMITEAAEKSVESSCKLAEPVIKKRNVELYSEENVTAADP